MRHFSARHGTLELLCLLPHEAVGPSSSCCSSILPENDAARKGIHQQQTQKNTAGRVLCTEILPDVSQACSGVGAMQPVGMPQPGQPENGED